MTLDASMLRDLEQHVRQLASAERAAEVFRTLLTASRLAAPRAAVFLVRRDGSQGWGSVGYDVLATRNQRSFTAPPGQGWMGRLVDSADDSRPRQAGVADPDFGQAPAAEAQGCVVRIKGKPIAVLVAERAAGETPWCPEVLDLLVTVGRLRLELDVARRKAEVEPPRAVPVPAAPRIAAVVASEPVRAPASPLPAASLTSPPESPLGLESEADSFSVAPLPPAAPARDEQQNLEAARRYARLVATDIRLYNEESVVQGRRNGDLLDRLGDQLDRGKETFLRRHGDLGPTGLAVLHEAYVQVLAGGDSKLIPSSALD
jgi:hypothetical protein